MPVHNRAPEFLGIFVTLTVIATVLVATRLWVRAMIVRKVGADDWVVLASLILTYCSMACMGSAVHNGLGQHTRDLTKDEAVAALKMLWIGFQLTPSAESTAKIAITIMLMRITNSKKWKQFFKFWIYLTILITIMTLYAIMLSCHPLDRLWDLTVPGACNAVERSVDIYIQGVIAALYDLVLATAPIFLLWNVQISWQNKSLLCGLLGLGYFTATAGIVRTILTPELDNMEDPTYAIMPFLIWKTVELPMSIIVGCLPTLRPLYEKAKQHSSRRGSRPLKDESFEFRPRSGHRIHKTTVMSIDFDAPEAPAEEGYSVSVGEMERGRR